MIIEKSNDNIEKNENQNATSIRRLLLLHLLLAFYSVGAIFSKLAGESSIRSIRFFLYYGVVLVILGIYAFVWQQIIKKVPIVTAYANKAITVIWGLVWGLLFFDEKITVQKIVGVIIVVAGIIIVVKSDE